ncbi:ribosomal protein S5 domain 2-type protein [Blastocladiella britannica]|nr:ribosomal protein S5 domain 2-type protein [Blastocladiella britannica]
MSELLFSNRQFFFANKEMVQEKLSLSTQDRETYLATLRASQRQDAREKDQARLLSIQYGPDFGYVEVQLGRTRCTCTVSATLGAPRMGESGEEGSVQFSIEISPMSAPGLESNRISEDEVSLARTLEKTLKRSRAIDTEGLCVQPGARVWTVRCDLRVLDDDGNLTDAVVLAALAGLLHFRRPVAEVIDDEVKVWTAEEKNPVPLTIYHAPFAVTFAFFHGGAVQVIDPTLLEESLAAGSLTVACNVHREMVAIAMSGGAPLAADQIIWCAHLAAEQVAVWTGAVRAAMLEDYTARGIKLHASNIFDKLEGEGGVIMD